MQHTKVRILIIDDHPLFVEGLKVTLLSLDERYQVDTASNVNEGYELLDNGKNYELILVDLNLPGQNGISFIKDLYEKEYWIPTAVISASEAPEDIVAVLNIGASGFINKSVEMIEFKFALDQILLGNHYVPDDYQILLQTSLSSAGESTNTWKTKAEQLDITPRQLDVLKEIAQGFSNKIICDRLGISESTIKSHTNALFKKLQVSNRTACIIEAGRLGLLPTSSS